MVKDWAKNNESTTQGDASEANTSQVENISTSAMPIVDAKLQQNSYMYKSLQGLQKFGGMVYFRYIRRKFCVM